MKDDKSKPGRRVGTPGARRRTPGRVAAASRLRATVAKKKTPHVNVNVAARARVEAEPRSEDRIAAGVIKTGDQVSSARAESDPADAGPNEAQDGAQDGATQDRSAKRTAAKRPEAKRTGAKPAGEVRIDAADAATADPSSAGGRVVAPASDALPAPATEDVARNEVAAKPARRASRGKSRSGTAPTRSENEAPEPSGRGVAESAGGADRAKAPGEAIGSDRALGPPSDSPASSFRSGRVPPAAPTGLAKLLAGRTGSAGARLEMSVDAKARSADLTSPGPAPQTLPSRAPSSGAIAEWDQAADAMAHMRDASARTAEALARLFPELIEAQLKCGLAATDVWMQQVRLASVIFRLPGSPWVFPDEAVGAVLPE